MKIKDYIISYLTLFSSVTTIFCCALPIILVTIGFGSAFAALSLNFPAINWLAENSTFLFLITAIFLILGGYLIFIKPQSCPTDKKLAEICQKTKRVNKIIWIISVLIFITSIFFKYILIKLV